MEQNQFTTNPSHQKGKEKGSVENLNGIFRRFIPKGKSIRDFSSTYISNVVLWANSLPRKILNWACW